MRTPKKLHHLFKKEECDIKDDNEDRNISPIKSAEECSPWTISGKKYICTTNKYLENDSKIKRCNVKKFDYCHNKGYHPYAKKISPFEELSIKCPECSYEINIIDNTYNLIVCNSPLNCKGNTKFCRKCLIIINHTNEQIHFQYGYYKPICQLSKMKKTINFLNVLA